MKSHLSLRIFSTTLMVLLSFNAVAPALAEAANKAASSSTASSQTVVLPAADDAAAIPEAKKSAGQIVTEEPQTPDPEETQTAPDPGVVDPVAKRDNAGAQPKEHVGEYNVDEFSGAFNYSYPISIPAGRNNVQPQVALNYNHQRVNIGSFVGFGWDIPMPAVERQARNGVDKLYTDNYFSLNLSGNADLEPISVDANGYGTYGKKSEDDFSKIEYSASGWIVTDKMGTKYTFGADSASRQDNPSDTTKVYKWLLTEIRDTNDNYVRYEYYKDSGQIYPKKIFYTGNGSTDGIYEVDFQPFASGTPTEDNLTSISYKTGFAVQTKYLLHRIEVKTKGVVTSAYDLTYILNQGGLKKLLTAIQPRAYQAGQEYSKDRVDLSYTTSQISFSSPSADYALPGGHLLGESMPSGESKKELFLDINQDSRADYVRIGCVNSTVSLDVYMNNGKGGWVRDTNYSLSIPGTFSCYYRTTLPIAIGEINGDRRPDIITDANYYINSDTGWTQQSHSALPVPLGFTAVGGQAINSTSFMDVNGDGFDDIVYNENTSSTTSTIRAYIHQTNGNWQLDNDYSLSVTAGASECFTNGGSPYAYADVNNDGLIDAFYKYSCSIGTNFSEAHQAVYLNSGTGFTLTTQFQSLDVVSVYGDTNIQQYIPIFSDIDGDGIADISDVSRWAQISPNGHRYSGGNVVLKGQEVFNTTLDGGLEYYNIPNPVAEADFDGDGIQDIMHSWSSGNPVKELYYTKSLKPDLVTSITYQSGAVIHAEYGNSSKEASQFLLPASPHLSFNLSVVKDVVMSDGNEMRGVKYNYGNGAVASYPSEKIRDIYGFGTVTAISGKAAAVTDGQGQTHYSVLNVTNDPTRSTRQTTYQVATGSLTSLDPSYYLHGKPLTTKTFDANNKQVAQSSSQWNSQAIDTKRSFSSVASQLQSSWPSASSTATPSSHTLAQYHLDGDQGAASKLVNATGNSAYDLQIVNVLDSDIGYTGVANGGFRAPANTDHGLRAPGLTTFTNSSFSIELWIKHQGATAMYKPFGKRDNNDYGTYAEFESDKSIHWRSEHDKYIWNVKTPANSLTLGDWHHYAFTMDTVSAKIYIDGILSAQGPVTFNNEQIGAASLNFFCASCGNNSSGPFIIDEIRISDIARTADQLFNDNPLYTPDETPVSQAKQYSYDSANGNLLTESDMGLVSANLTNGTFTNITGDEKTTTYTYASNGTKHILAAPKTKTVAGLGESKPEDFYYDQQAHGDVDKANVTKEDLKSNTVDIETTYNNFGLPLTKKDPKDNTAATLSYDSDNMFVATSTDALGRSTVTKTDPITGQLLYSRDPNGYQEKYSYDAWGRVTKKEVSDPANVAALIIKQEVYYSDVANGKNKSELSNDASTTGLWHMNGSLTSNQKKQNEAGGTSIIEQTQPKLAEGFNGDLDGAYRMKGQTGSYLQFSPYDSYNFDQNDFSIEFWMKSTSSDSQVILNKHGDAGGVSGWTVWLNANLSGQQMLGKVAFTFQQDNDSPTHQVRVVSSTNVNDGAWHFIAVTRQGRSGHLFVDGKEEFNNNYGANATSSDNPNVSSNSEFSTRRGSSGIYTGYLDEVRVSSLALSPQAILNDYDKPAPFGNAKNHYREIKDYFKSGSYTTSREYYDGLGRVIQTSSLAAGNQYVTTYKQYDGQGRLAKESLPLFTASADFNTSPSFTNAKVTTYDAQGRPLTETTPTGTTSYAYDGLVTTITDPRTKVKKLTNDAFGNLVKVEESNSGATYTTNYEYSLTNKLKKITDALGNIRTFTYDALDNLTQQDMVHTAGTSNPGHWTYTYDKNGNVLSKVDLKSQTSNYSYDALNRLLTENFTGKTGTEYTMTYDQGTKQLGRLTRVVGSDGLTTVYTYDPQGKPLTVVRTIDGTSYTLTYAYDWNGNVTSITYPEGERIDYLYNAVGQINQVNKVKNGTTTVLASGVTYTPMGQIAHLQRGNNVTTDYTYDANQNYRLTRIRTVSGAVVLQDIAYTYDANGNILTIVDSSQTALAKNVAYGYDDLNRLISATVTNSGSGANYSHTYSYDAIGNILSSTPVGSYTYTLSNPHQARTAGSTTLTYDNNGNVVYINQDHQSYDWRDRMTYSADAGSADHTEYVYDHANQRVKKHTVVYVPAGGGADCETHPDQCPDPIYGIPRELPPVVTPPPGKLPLPIEVIVPTPDQEGEVSSINNQIPSSSARQNNTETQNSNNQETGNLELGSASGRGTGAEVTAQTVETNSTSTAPILTVEPAEPLPIGSFELSTTTPETVVTTPDPSIQPPISELLTSDSDATSTDESALSLENPTPDAAPSASDHVTYYIDKYYEKEWNGSSKNHYFLGTISLATDNLSGSTAGLFYTLGDHLGSSSLITNSYGNMTERAEYYPFGQVAATAVSQDSGNRYTFTGKELDPETNLQYFGARYYGQNLGRFMAIDPYGLQMSKLMKVLSDPQSLNGYAYTRNNPIVLVDPDGNEVVWNSMLQKINGAGNAILSNNAFGYGRVQSNDSSYYTGQRVGDVMSVIQGGLEILNGAGTVVIGAGGGAAFAGATGGLSVIGGMTVSAVGIAQISHGGGVMLTAGHYLLSDSGSSGPYIDNVDGIIPPKQQEHILKGNETGGGHQAGAGKGKPEFPASWSGKQIFHNGADIATDPTLEWTWQERGSWLVKGIRDNINIGVVIDKTKSIIKTIFPIK